MSAFLPLSLYRLVNLTLVLRATRCSRRLLLATRRRRFLLLLAFCHLSEIMSATTVVFVYFSAEN